MRPVAFCEVRMAKKTKKKAAKKKKTTKKKGKGKTGMAC